MPTPDPHAAARRLAELDLDAHLGDPRRKQDFVTPMFDVIAPQYDAFTRLFSFGMDAKWKRVAVAALAAQVPAGSALADLACGTGDLARDATAAIPQTTALGLDASTAMISAATQRASGQPHLRFAVATLLALPVRTGSMDGLTAGYAFRNVPALGPALAECSRALKPGGTLVVLDFYRPSRRWWAWLFTTYLRVAGNIVGWWWHRTPVVFGYLGPSVARWITAPAMTTALRDAGFTVTTTHTWLGGGVALHVATRATPLSHPVQR
jgi:demethylmenaquinone methyltransferase/2-methoxy-6-polyprenyl-1,4-benzoquinol methylase